MTKKKESIYNKEKAKELLKKRQNIQCKCKKQKSREKHRVKFGTCLCDSFSLCHTMGIVMSNYLLQYIADASQAIVRTDEEWAIIEKYAYSIRDYAESDSWDKFSTSRDNKEEVMDSILYDEKERKWREAMFWLTENWQSLWW